MTEREQFRADFIRILVANGGHIHHAISQAKEAEEYVFGEGYVPSPMPQLPKVIRSRAEVLSQSDVMRAAIEAGVVNNDDEGNGAYTTLETHYFDLGSDVAIRISRSGLVFANRWKRTADIAEVKAWLSSLVN